MAQQLLSTPATTESTNYVVYLHGGGMIYGTKSDLPEELKELFTKQWLYRF